jgi:hypothetical protein
MGERLLQPTTPVLPGEPRTACIRSPLIGTWDAASGEAVAMSNLMTAVQEVRDRLPREVAGHAGRPASEELTPPRRCGRK